MGRKLKHMLVAGIGITYQLAIFQEGHDVFSSEAGRWITSDAALTLWYSLFQRYKVIYRMLIANSTNVYCSGKPLSMFRQLIY